MRLAKNTYDQPMHVKLVAATSIDGFIARRANERSFDWTSAEDKALYISQIKEAGAVIMGSTSFQTFTRYPRGLTFAIYTHHPEKFVNPRPDVITAFGTAAAPAELLTELAERGHDKVIVAGGASIYAQFLQAGVVDTILLTVEPVVFGKGVPLFGQEIGDKLQNWHLQSTQQLNESTIALEYTRL